MKFNKVNNKLDSSYLFQLFPTRQGQLLDPSYIQVLSNIKDIEERLLE